MSIVMQMLCMLVLSSTDHCTCILEYTYKYQPNPIERNSFMKWTNLSQALAPLLWQTYNVFHLLVEMKHKKKCAQKVQYTNRLKIIKSYLSVPKYNILVQLKVEACQAWRLWSLLCSWGLQIKISVIDISLDEKFLPFKCSLSSCLRT